MDVLHARSLDQDCVVGSEPGVQKRAQPPPLRLASLNRAAEEILEHRKLQETQERSLDQQLHLERLQIQSFGCKSL